MATKFEEYEAAIGITLEEWIASGKSASEFNENYNKWSENQEAFYDSMVRPSSTVFLEKSTNNSNSKAMPDVNKEMDRIQEQLESKDETRPGYFKIGTVELTIPPLQISVSDIKHNVQHKTLRTKSDIIFQSGKSTKIIELDVYFHDIDNINNKLRPLLAQLKCMPFIPIYSDYLGRILDPDGPSKNIKLTGEGEKKIDVAKVIRENNALIDKEKTNLRDAIRKNTNLTGSKPNLIVDLNDYWNGELSQLNVSKIDSKNTLTENINSVLIEAGIAENKEDKNSVKYQAAITEEKIKGLREINGEHLRNIDPIRDDSNLVGVLSQISLGTVAGFPESLACHLTMFLFNYLPFSSRFELLDNNNNPTRDIDKCTYFIQWYTTRFLTNKDDSSGQYYKPLLNKMEGSVSILYAPEGSQYPITVSTSKNSACSSIMVVQKNSISFLPVLQWPVPTCQYMGAYNSEVLITFDTIDDEFIDGLRNIFDQVEERSRGGEKDRRKNYVVVNNELVHLAGIRNCVLQKMDTSTVEGSPGMSRITLTLTEFDVNQLKQEKIKKINLSSDDMLREFFRADVESFRSDLNNISDSVALKGEKKGKTFRDAISDFNTYFDAVGFRDLTMGEPGWVPFMNSERQVNKLMVVIKDAGYTPSIRNNRIYVRAKGNARDTPVPYENHPHKEKVAKHLMGRILNSENTDKNKEYELETLLFNAPALDWYRNVYSKNIIDSYLKGNSTVLPENVRAAFEKSGITNKESRLVYTYPDMDLPTYTDTKNVGVGADKPTYTRLGTRNPRLKQYETPRIDSDIVEPDFCFYYESIASRTYLFNDKPLSFYEKKNEGIKIFIEDFKMVVQTDMPNYIAAAGNKAFNNYMSDMDIDDILNDEAAKEKEEKIAEEQAKARARRDNIQTQSADQTSSVELKSYEEDSDSVFQMMPSEKTNFKATDVKERAKNKSSVRFSLLPPDQTMYNQFKADKGYSEDKTKREADSGKDPYGGILPDSSVFEEIEDNG